MDRRNSSGIAVACSILALVSVAVTVSRIDTKDQSFIGDAGGFVADPRTESEESVVARLDKVYPLVEICDIPNPSTFPEESVPILDLLSDHDITCCTFGSMSHSLFVSKNRVAEARKLLKEHFPSIRLAESRDTPSNPESFSQTQTVSPCPELQLHGKSR